MNKFVFGAVAVVALLGIGVFALQSNEIQQAASPDKAETPVTTVQAEGCCGGCSSSEKSALVSAEAAKSPCCAGSSTEVAAKAGCCGGCAETETVSTSSETKECDGDCQEGDGSKCCQLAKKEGESESKTEAVSTSEEDKGSQ